MKYKLKYSPDAREKLIELKAQIGALYGKETAAKIVSKITNEIRGLQDYPKKGVSVEDILGISTPYRCLRVEHNFAFYRLDKDTVYVAEIFNEREDFMGRMFGVDLRTPESIDFWGE